MRRVLLMVGAISLLSTACGGSGSSLSGATLEKAIESQAGGDIGFEQTGDGFTVETEDGSLSVRGDEDGQVISGTDSEGNDFKLTDSTEVPKGFPLPIPDNVEVVYGSTTEMGGEMSYSVTISFDPSRVDELVAFFEKAFTDAGLDIVGSSRFDDSAAIVADSGTISGVIDMQNYGNYWEAGIFWTPL